MRAALAALAAVVCHAACSGKAIIDDPIAAGGGGATSTSTGHAGEDGSPICVTPDPVGQLSVCAGSSGGPGTCQSAVCDEGGQIWESSCEGSACVCIFNFKTKCTCVVEGATLCQGNVPSCCPKPFPK